MRLLTEEDVSKLLSPEQLLPAVEAALIAFSRGEIQQPVRSILRVPQHHGGWGLMPAVWGDVMGIKLVTLFEDNAAHGLPTHQATIQLFSAITGEPLVVMDGRLITELRTAAVTAVAVRLLTSPDARSLAILGSGVQARSHLRALRLIRNFTDIRVWSRTPANAARFANEAGGLSLPLEETIRGADVIIAVANTETPLVHGAWLKPNAFVAAVGTVGLHRRELDDETMQSSSIIVESLDSALQESGDIVHSGAPIYAELGELLAGIRPLPSRDGSIVFKSLGIAATDLAAARLVLESLTCKS
jgi:ornithine cyclodeaminase/alanine dehydrogenase-like protein (mu-crystallin family)